jgi:hypothetical protein
VLNFLHVFVYGLHTTTNVACGLLTTMCLASGLTHVRLRRYCAKHCMCLVLALNTIIKCPVPSCHSPSHTSSNRPATGALQPYAAHCPPANLSEVRRIFLRAWALHTKKNVLWAVHSNVPCPSQPVRSQTDFPVCMHGLHRTKSLFAGLLPTMCLTPANLSEVRRIVQRAWAAHDKHFGRWAPPNNVPS